MHGAVLAGRGAGERRDRRFALRVIMLGTKEAAPSEVLLPARCLST